LKYGTAVLQIDGFMILYLSGSQEISFILYLVYGVATNTWVGLTVSGRRGLTVCTVGNYAIMPKSITRLCLQV